MNKYTWRELNQTLSTKTEAEVLEMLDEERSGRNRKVVLKRLHQRYSSLRASSERLEIMSNAKIESWITKSMPLKSEEQNDAIDNVGFIPIRDGDIADEMKQSLIDALEKQLAFIDKQQSTIETLRAINEVLKSTNEELRSAKSAQRLLVEDVVTVNSDLNPTDAAPSSSSDIKLVIGISNLDKRIDEAIFDALNAFDKKCPYCSKNLYEGGIRDKMEIDHFFPISRGGQHFPWNLMPICKDCNRKKRAKLPTDFLSPEVFDRINTYLLQVRKKFFDEGIVAHTSINSLRDLLIKNEDVIRQLNSHDFIKSLVHLVMPDRASLLEQAMGRPTALLLNMIRNLEGPFERGVISAPFHALCADLHPLFNLAPGQRIFPAHLLDALLQCNWLDCGRVTSAELPTRRHVYCAPEFVRLTKSELRRAVEDAN